MGPSARIWKIILDEKKSDREMINSWKGSNRWVLISAGFSAVVAASFLPVNQGRKPDHACVMLFLFEERLALQRAIANAHGDPPILVPAFDKAGCAPLFTNPWIGGLWFASLILSVSTALFAINMSYWSTSYLKQAPGSLQNQVRTCHFRLMNLKKWRVGLLVDLPLFLLYLALVLLLAGLGLFAIAVV